MLVGFCYAVPNQLPMVARAIEKKKEKYHGKKTKPPATFYK